MTRDPALDALTVGAARERLFKQMDGRGCPCCGQIVRLSRRHITSAMAIGLLELVRYSREHPDVQWLHVQNILAERRSHAARGGDITKLRFWGLIEPHVGVRDVAKAIERAWLNPSDARSRSNASRSRRMEPVCLRVSFTSDPVRSRVSGTAFAELIGFPSPARRPRSHPA